MIERRQKPKNPMRFFSDELINKIKDEEDKKERVYHYTSLETFYKIVEGAQDDIFTFYAGSVSTMNDSLEMLLGYNKIIEYLPIVEKKLKVSPTDSLLLLFDDKKANQEAIDNFGEWMINDDLANFVVSFSSKPDILPMWTFYGDNGLGVCFEFSPYMIKEYYNKKEIENNLQIEKCVYTEDVVKEFVLSELEVVYNGFIGNYEMKSSQIKRSCLAAMCRVIGAFVKHKGFAYEEEKRMILFRNKKDWKIGETRNGHKTVYVEIPIPINSLTNVYIGPAAEYCEVKNSITMALRMIGLHVEPIKSLLPFRLY